MFPTRAQISTLDQALGADLILFIPELVLCGGIVLLLVCRLLKFLDRSHLGGVAIAVLGVALFGCVASSGVFLGNTTPVTSTSFFSGMLVADPFGAFVRAVVLAASLVTVLLTRLTGIPDRDDSGDFYALLLGGTLGMMLMASANHLLMVFIAIEMASLPSYAMAGFLKGRRQGSEASLKYVVYGAGASGVMLYGISLLAGTFGTGHIPDLTSAIGLRLAAQGGFDAMLFTGLAMVFVGLGFKLAAVPFHFWCPDVFTGAAAEVAGFLSVASKAGAIALTARLLLTLHAAIPAVAPSGATVMPMLLAGSLGLAVGIVAAITVTFGNLAAFGQSNLKRMLAYSTIAHAGYMMLGLAVVTAPAASAVLYYLVAYLLMNLGAFAVVALVRNATGSEDLEAFRGLIWRSPLLAVAMALFLFSLLGFPPLAGFAGKFQVFMAVYDAGRNATTAGRPELGTAFYALLGIGALNTVMSAYYYLRVVRLMFLDSPVVATPLPRLSLGASSLLVGLTAALVALGIIWNPLTAETDRAASTFAPMIKATIPQSGIENAPPAQAPPGAGAPKGKGPNPKQKGPKS